MGELHDWMSVSALWNYCLNPPGRVYSEGVDFNLSSRAAPEQRGLSHLNTAAASPDVQRSEERGCVVGVG